MSRAFHLIASLTIIIGLSLGHQAFAQDAAAKPEAVSSEDLASTNKDVTGDVPFPVTASHMILLDADSNTLLSQKHADEKMFPSSMSKLMTLYVVFDELKKGTLKPTDEFTVSEKAWAIQGSKMFVPIHSAVKVEDLIHGIATQSGNDACIVIAEGLSGSEEAFAQRLNETAKKLGMTNSHFVNASGWPDENHYTTARDLSTLALHLIHDFPEYYTYFALPEFTYNGIRQYNRNPLLSKTGLGVDGLKTGHTEIAGYGIVLSAKHPVSGRRLVLVVNGLSSMKEREQQGEVLLNWGFRNFETATLVQAGQVVTKAPVWLGEENEVELSVGEDVKLTLPVGKASAATAKAIFESPVAAPIKQGQPIGKLVLTLPSGDTREVPLLAAKSVDSKGAFARIPAVISSWLGF